MVKYAIAAAALSAMLWSPAQAEMNGATRIGVLNDMSSVYSDFQGPGSVVAAQMAAEQFAKGSKRKVEILSADHQNKPDIGAEIARRWLDVEPATRDRRAHISLVLMVGGEDLDLAF